MVDAASVYLVRELFAKLEEIGQPIRKRVLNGQVEDHSEYKFLAGQLLAYRKVVEMINDIMKLDEPIKPLEKT